MREPEAELARTLVALYVRDYPGEVARDLEDLPADEIAEYLGSLPLDDAASVVSCLRPGLAAEVLDRCPDALAAATLGPLEATRSAGILARLDPDRRTRVMQSLPPGLAEEVEHLLAHPADSAGHLMEPKVTTFRLEETVDSALERLRLLPPDRRPTELIVVDVDGHLAGTIPVQELALADGDTPLEALALWDPPHVLASASREEILEVLEARPATSLPVTAFDGTLLGVIRPEGWIEAAQAEASADIQTMVGASKDEQALSPTWFAVRRRQPWLQMNLLTAFGAASVVGLFEGTIARFTALAVLMPIIAGESGNTGQQALAVTMRGLALEEVGIGDWWRVALKEVGAALVNGLAVATTACLAVYLWSHSPGLTFVVGCSMVISMTMAGLTGALIPMGLTALGHDPAQASSILLTTVTDVVGFLSFLGIATWLAFLL